MSAVAEWEFECAEPEVGFLSDTVTHACTANVEGDAEAAVVADVTTWNLPDGKVVREQTTWKCPVCEATTTSVDDWPRWMFES